MSLSLFGPSIGQKAKSRERKTDLCPIDRRTWALRLLSSKAVSSQVPPNCSKAGAVIPLRLEP